MPSEDSVQANITDHESASISLPISPSQQTAVAGGQAVYQALCVTRPLRLRRVIPCWPVRNPRKRAVLEEPYSG